MSQQPGPLGTIMAGATLNLEGDKDFRVSYSLLIMYGELFVSGDIFVAGALEFYHQKSWSFSERSEVCVMAASLELYHVKEEMNIVYIYTSFPVLLCLKMWDYGSVWRPFLQEEGQWWSAKVAGRKGPVGAPRLWLDQIGWSSV